MAFKDILVHIDSSDACTDRVAAALALAERHEARVIGAALALESTISSYVGIAIPASLVSQQKEIVQKSAEEAVAKFTEAAKAAGVAHDSVVISCSASKAPARLAYHARHVDLTFMGQPNPDDDNASFNETLLDGVLFASGRPVYVVPYIGRNIRPIRKAVIAWDGGKKAVRALNDAIPILKDRNEVIVLVINPDDRGDAHGDKPGAEIAAHLARHGIEAKVDLHVAPDASADNLILNYLSDTGADLLVMGAYSHSRLRERAFGGVTNTILKQMITPVLMAE
ncbi:universal stress protein [Pseudahrensia aquimaris]|uniref:Universal stress protein n=1 Tax=Pseudahrensia aquimaris TaxID=744461 RepID=A0ABW3FB95_9HYPH